LVAEELSRGWMSVASVLARGNSFYRMVPGSGEQRKRRIERMAAGDYLGALAISEPGAGSDMSAIRTRAQRDGDHWVVNGNKYWCTFADEADFLSVVCRVDDGDGGSSLQVIPVDKQRGGFPAGVQGAPIPKIGYHGWRTFELAFDSARVPAQTDQPAQDLRAIKHTLTIARAHTAARSIGLAQAALDQAMAYACERVQFGRPIAQFQAIRFKIATMATEIEAARALMYSVASRVDAGERADKEAAMVKYFASEMSERVTSEAMQILGGAGYTTDYPVERYWRDARLTKIFEGTSEIMQKIISDRLLGREK
ncbi:MAG: acyl-CoA dehydrogenase family protein, partial [Salinisphaera sp.]|nr:acyl-CoA dehydrogenase family protein [Salinisphaera sp.]